METLHSGFNYEWIVGYSEVGRPPTVRRFSTDGLPVRTKPLSLADASRVIEARVWGVWNCALEQLTAPR